MKYFWSYNKLDEEINSKRIPLTSEIKEDLETNFLGIIAIIRNFRNESGHPTGNIISREQCYVNLNLFIQYCKKMYQLMDFFKSNSYHKDMNEVVAFGEHKARWVTVNFDIK